MFPLKRLVRLGGIPLFNISEFARNKLIDYILGIIYKTLPEMVQAAFLRHLIL